MYNVISGSVVDVLELMQSSQDILLVGNVKGILEMQLAGSKVM